MQQKIDELSETVVQLRTTLTAIAEVPQKKLTSVKDACEHLLEIARVATSAQHGSVILWNKESGRLETVVSSAMPNADQRRTFAEAEGFAGYAYAHAEVVCSDNAQDDASFVVFRDQEIRFGPMITAPVMWEGKPIGALSVHHPAGGAPFRKEQVAIVGSIATYAGALIQLTRLAEECRRAAQIDPLSGLYRREVFSVAVMDRLAGGGESYVHLIMLDVDGFKKINDTLGHLTGDRLVQEIGERLRLLSQIRADMIVARWGGDEFMVCLQVPFFDDAAPLVRDLRRQVATVRNPVTGKDVECSIGTSTRRAEMTATMGRSDREETYNAMVREADKAMYEDKAQRRAAGLKSQA